MTPARLRIIGCISVCLVMCGSMPCCTGRVFLFGGERMKRILKNASVYRNGAFEIRDFVLQIDDAGSSAGWFSRFDNHHIAVFPAFFHILQKQRPNLKEILIIHSKNIQSFSGVMCYTLTIRNARDNLNPLS